MSRSSGLDLWSLALRLPSVRSWCESVWQSLNSRESVVVILPRSMGTTEIRSLLAETQTESTEIRTLTVTDQMKSPQIVLENAFDIAWPDRRGVRTIGDILRYGKLPDVVELDGVCRMGPEGQAKWVEFVRSFGSCAEGSCEGYTSPDSVLLVFCTCEGLISTDTTESLAGGVRFVRWASVQSILEMELLVRTAVGAEQRDPELLWKSRVLPQIVGNDIDLLSWLLAERCYDEEELLKVLRAKAEARGWSEETLMKAGSPDIGSLRWVNPVIFTEKQRARLMAEGMLRKSPENGFELSPLAVAVLDDRVEFRRRLWRGQASLLMPIVEDIRIAASEALTAEFGEGWPRWLPEGTSADQQREVESPDDCGLGHMENLVRRDLRLNRYRGWASLLRNAVKVRNWLAHGKPVSFDQYKELVRLLRTARPSLGVG